MDTTELVRQAGPIGFPPVARGHILKAPLSYTEGVRVVLPEGSSERTYGPCKWVKANGSTKPAAGAECVVTFDEQNQPTVVWWEGIFAGGGGGGEEYKAGEGLEESGSKPVKFLAKVTGAIERSASGLNVKAKGITEAMLETPIQTKLGEIKAYTAKAAGGLELVAGAFGIKAEGVTNAMVVAAAGIPESKLSTPEMVKLTGEQSVTGKKLFTAGLNTGTVPTAEENAEELAGEGSPPLTAAGGAGGNTSNTETAFGGIGGPVGVTAGKGGEASHAMILSTGGFGGHAYVNSGAGGKAVVVGGEGTEGGAGGLLKFEAGVGGEAGEGSVSNLGGKGGAWSMLSGVGGASTKGTGTRTGGAGGNFAFQAGKGGAGTTKGGAGGPLNFTAGEGAAANGAGGSMTFTAGNSSGSGVAGAIVFKTGAAAERLKITGAGVVEIKAAASVEGALKLTKGYGAWTVTPPAAQHAAIANPTTLIEVAEKFKELNEVIKSYGLTA